MTDEVIAELVGSTNRLTELVDLRIQDILNKADQTANNILDGIHTLTGFYELYLDANGSDDNDGKTQETAVSSVDKLLQLIPDGRSVIVRVPPNQHFTVSNARHLYQNTVMFYKSDDRGNTATNPVFNIATSENGTSSFVIGELILLRSSVLFHNVDINIMPSPNPALPWTNRNAFVSTENTYGGTAEVICTSNKCTVRSGTMIIRAHIAANLNIAAKFFELDGPGHMCGDAHWGTVTLAVFAVAETNGAQMMSGQTTNGNSTNILTNYTGILA